MWSNNIQDDSEEIAKKTFLELEQHKLKIEETKLSIQNYKAKNDKTNESDVKDLLALGEEEVKQESPIKKKKKIRKQDSDSEMEDWEEVNGKDLIINNGSRNTYFCLSYVCMHVCMYLCLYVYCSFT